ncbi:MAG TPA: hypothetical protein VIN67_07860 [Desulfobaccales bacterium]
MALQGEVLLRVIEALTRLQTEVSGIGEREFARIPKTGPKEIIISTVPPEDPQALPGVDVREFLNTPRYTGPTKKGIRFPWDKLPEVMGLMQIQAQRLGAQEQQNQPPTLFPLNRPLWVDQVEAARQPSPSEIDPVLGKLFSDGPKKFPEDFLTGQEGDLIEVRLPSDPLEVVSTRDGKYEVRSPRGFCYSVRNPVEGNYLCYAGLCGERVIYLPQKMLSVFKVVTSYKKYLREQGQSLIQEYERKCGHRPLALHKAKEAFRRFGLPWIPE